MIETISHHSSSTGTSFSEALGIRSEYNFQEKVGAVALTLALVGAMAGIGFLANTHHPTAPHP